MKKAISIAALALAGVVGTNASATPICEFVSPTDGGPRYGHGHYWCGFFGCNLVWYLGGSDWYAAETEDRVACNLAAETYAQFPFYHWSRGQAVPPCRSRFGPMRRTTSGTFLGRASPGSV